MCNCTGNSCGCSTVSGRRGRPGETGPAGPAGADGADGQNAQVLSDFGAPTTTLPAGPTPATAFAVYYDETPGGNVWEWDGSSWTDTGIPISGKNAWTLSTSPEPTIGADGAVFSLNVQNTSWMGTGQLVHITSAGLVDLGYYTVFTVVSPTQVFLRNPRVAATGEYPDNANGSVVTVGSKVSPGGIQGPAGIPVEFTTGAPDPTVAPGGNASGFYVQSGTGGTYWYYNGASAGPWTDTTISVIGPTGPAGADGAAGHTPVITYVTASPTTPGGASGDIRLYQPPSNSGTTTFYFNTSGVWNPGPTILSSRLLGYSMVSATPNPGSLPANVSDYYWTYVAGRLIFHVCTVAGAPGTWTPAIDILMTGGSGAPVDAEYIVASSNATLSNERVANSTATIVPDTSVAGQMRWNVPDDGITNAKLNNVPSNTFKGLGLGGPANPIDMTANQASTVLDTATDPFVRTSAIPGGTVSLQSASNGSPALGDGVQTGDDVWTMQRSIQYEPHAQATTGTGTLIVLQTDEYQHIEVDYQHDSVTIGYDPPTYNTSGYMLGINNTTPSDELSIAFSSSAWKANQGVTVPSSILPGISIVLVASYVDGFMVITNVIQNTTTL